MRRRSVLVLVALMIASLFTSAPTFAAGDDAELTVVHGIPGITVDVYGNGANALPNFEETLEGAQRVAEIVRAIREFAHPGSQSKSSVDITRVVQTTMQVSRNEWKYVADLELELDETIPIIEGHAGPLGQILLVMFVNSAQAMAEHRSESDGKGVIRVTTTHDEEMVEIRVADNGPGIPQEIVDRVFDPFFTTKDVGKGSGQGLSIARSVVVDKHQGEIWIEDGNPGAVFVIRLPISAPRRSDAATDEPSDDE